MLCLKKPFIASLNPLHNILACIAMYLIIQHGVSDGGTGSVFGAYLIYRMKT